MNHLPDHYCVHMHAGLQLNFDKVGNFTAIPCTVWKGAPVDGNTTDIFNHPKLLSIRQQNVNESKLIDYHCDKCIKSPTDNNRTAWNDEYHIIKPLYNLSGPIHLSVRLDTSCNLACITCGPELSTKWRLENKIKTWAVRPNLDIIKQTLSNINFDNLKVIHVFGGEPFIGPTTEILLEVLRPYLDKLTIWFDTNGTVLPTENILKLLSLCKKVYVKFSIDAVNEQFELIRWPGTWQQTETVMKTLNSILPNNFSLSLRPTIGILNGHIVKDIESWHKENLTHRPNGEFIPIEYYGNNGTFSFFESNNEFVNEIRNMYPTSHKIHRVLPCKDYYVIDHLQNAFDQLDQLDQKRKTNWKKTLPNLYRHYKEK